MTCTECGRKDIPRSQVSYAPRGFLLLGVLFLHTPRNNDCRFKFDLQRTRKCINGFLTASSYTIFLTQMRAHIDLVNGDCEEIQSSCPWTQIGCPETKVCKYLPLLQLGGDRALNGSTLNKKMTLIAFCVNGHHT